MYSSGYVYRFLSKELERLLEGARLIDCFSTDKAQIQFVFSGKKEELGLQVKFLDGEMYFTTAPLQRTKGRNTLPQFKSCHGECIAAVKWVHNDRAFVLEFENENRILFKGFGRFGNILLYLPDADLPESIFRSNLTQDLQMPFPQPIHKEGSGTSHFKHEKSLMEVFPVFTPEIRGYLAKTGFYGMSSEAQKSELDALHTTLASGRFYYDATSDPPKLFLLPHKGVQMFVGMDGLNQYVQLFQSRFFFLREKETGMQQMQASITRLEGIVKESNKRLESIKHRRSYKELGDIVMAYAHSIKPGVSNALLTDFYTQSPIRIALNPDISAAENAEKFYRKAKREHLEQEKLLDVIAATTKQLEYLKGELLQFQEANSFADLPRGKTKKTVTKQEALPYHEHQFNGFTIWVGKNAGSNDILLKLAGKNDLWLHARGVAGSHVIIRKKGNQYPAEVIQFAAKLAAENSKAKRQQLVPVYCVERKFVSKPKGARPGEVRVFKETVVDAQIN